MTFGEVLNTIIIAPLQLIFEVVFMLSNKIVHNPGISIVALSLVMNFLLLPLYMRADALQEEERNTEKKLRDGVAHIKKYFSGNERMMILQTYYRQNDYKPTYVLRGAASLFLEIPFFIAAYRFLSGLQLLHGVSFGPISDLGKPDGLLILAGATINLLPIIMTAINLVTCIIFTKGATLKSKIQLYGMALFFLVFLYKSPAGLVFYWTLNNLFSLIKTIFYKLKNPGKILGLIFSISGVAIIAYGCLFYPFPTLRKTVFFVFCGIIFQLPLLYRAIKGKIRIKPDTIQAEKSKLFFVSGVFLSILIGLLIPSAVIRSSPQEFVDINNYYNPLWFIVSSFCYAFGFFVIWANVFYRLANPSIKGFLGKCLMAISAVTITNYMFFGKNLGILSNTLQYERGLNFTFKVQLINLGIIMLIAIVVFLFAKRFDKQALNIVAVGCVAIFCMATINTAKIANSIDGIKELPDAQAMQKPHFNLSKTGKNVVVIMFDRAKAEYIPYIFNEKPELKEKFSGFTYYSNVISFGPYTNFAVPALFGGYEYTPVELNKKNTETLVKKHNESIKVLPVLFSQNNFDVTVFDPVYENYKWSSDLSTFAEFPELKVYNTKGKFSDTSDKKVLITDNKRNFFYFSVLKAAPLAAQETLYDFGRYLNQRAYIIYGESELSAQVRTSNCTANGIFLPFLLSYDVLDNLPRITHITDDDRGTLLLMTNETTHEPMLLQEPDYKPAIRVDNTEFEKYYEQRFNNNGRRLRMENELHFTHYHINMATMLKMGEWFDYLRENNLYNNTRIVLVSDHGHGWGQCDELLLSDGTDATYFYPLLMVKDFDSEGFHMSETFMTNADVPTIATKDLISNPRNPFTGNIIDSSEKTAHDQYIIFSNDLDPMKNNGNAFTPAKWISVKDDIWDINNWKVFEGESVLPPIE